MRATLILHSFALAAVAFAEEIPVLKAEPVGALKAAVEIAPVGETAVQQAQSRSEQFQVIGGSAVLRASVAMLAEEAKNELLELTGEKDTWKEAEPNVPISIFLRGTPGDPVPPRTIAMSLFFNETGYDLRLDVHLSRGIERERFRNAVTSSLLYERSLRGRRPKADAEVPLVVPPWLVEGLREAADWRKQRSDRRPYEVLFKRGGVYDPADLFATDDREHGELDAAMRTAFRISSGALVMALLEQPDGQEGFRKMLSEVASYQGEMPTLLRQHFPGLNLSDTSLAKWWYLQMATKATATLTDVLTIVETEAALNDALRLQFRDADGISQDYPLGRWSELPEMPTSQLATAVRPAQESLTRLSYRCFPSYRPLIAEYQIVLGSLSGNRTTRVAEQLEDLDRTRAIMIGKAERARDFLDWFEITRARETSGAFEDYLRLKDRLKEDRRQRNDDLSQYLDRMERIFSRSDSPFEAAQAP